MIKLYMAICIFLLPGLVLPSNENPHVCNTNTLSDFLSLLPWVYMPGTDPPASHFHFYLALRNIVRFLSYLPPFIPNLVIFRQRCPSPIQKISYSIKKDRNHTDSGLFYTGLYSSHDDASFYASLSSSLLTYSKNSFVWDQYLMPQFSKFHFSI